MRSYSDQSLCLIKYSFTKTLCLCHKVSERFVKYWIDSSFHCLSVWRGFGWSLHTEHWYTHVTWDNALTRFKVKRSVEENEATFICIDWTQLSLNFPQSPKMHNGLECPIRCWNWTSKWKILICKHVVVNRVSNLHFFLFSYYFRQGWMHVTPRNKKI